MTSARSSLAHDRLVSRLFNPSPSIVDERRQDVLVRLRAGEVLTTREVHAMTGCAPGSLQNTERMMSNMVAEGLVRRCARGRYVIETDPLGRTA